MAPTVFLDAQARLGECPLWCEHEQALWWTDIDGATLHCWRQAGGSVQRWPMPEPLGSLALCGRPGLLLLGLASGVALFDSHLPQGGLGPITPVEADQPDTRLNDGRCDPQGRFVFGTFNALEDGRPLGHFYRAEADLTVQRLPLPACSVANSLAFSPDGGTMYFTDSPTREILCVDYHADGRLGRPQTFARIDADGGLPDGAAVDAQGHLWVAVWGGGCVLRFDAAGRETLRLPLPTRYPTCPVFGGAGLDRLFVTSARKALDEDALRREPAAGAVLVAEGLGPGRPAQRFIPAGAR